MHGSPDRQPPRAREPMGWREALAAALFVLWAAAWVAAVAWGRP